MTRLAAFVAASLLLASPARAQLLDKKVMSLAEARKAAAAAVAEARKNGWAVVVAVVDDAGFLVTLDRIDGAQRASVDIAIGKARTAALFRRPSAALENAIDNVAVCTEHNREHTCEVKGRTALISVPGYAFLQGGMPVIVNGEVVGAVGASGVKSEQDEQVAKAGVDAIAPPR